MSTYQQTPREMLSELRRDDPDAMLPAYAWPGGYTVVYWCEDGEPLCAQCATMTIDQALDWEPFACETYDEGPTVPCSHCGDPLESSYGDPDAETEVQP